MTNENGGPGEPVDDLTPSIAPATGDESQPPGSITHSLPYELFIAIRYLRARRKQVMISVITVISVGAVAAGVASLITVLAMMTGFREEFQTKILSGTAHLNLLRKDGHPIEDYQQLKQTASSVPGVRAAAGTLYYRVLIEGRGDTEGALVKGVDMEAPREANEVFQFTVSGDPGRLAELDSAPESGARMDKIMLGRDLAQAVGAEVGDVVTLISPGGHLTPVGMAPRYRYLKVEGLFQSGLAEYDSTWAYVSLDAAKRLSGDDNPVQLLQITVDDIYAVKEIGRELLKVVGNDFAVRDWQELNAPIYTALSYEKLVSAVALVIVVGIASLNIITVLVMMVMEKQRDIGVLKSMGATKRSVMLVFVLQGVLIGIVGMVIGILGGASFCHFANSRQWIKLPAGAYALSYLPFHSHASDIVLVSAVAFLITLLATLYPSWSAARLDPVEALRYD
jgi:lipoprotein-releasing system permease protein